MWCQPHAPCSHLKFWWGLGLLCFSGSATDITAHVLSQTRPRSADRYSLQQTCKFPNFLLLFTGLRVHGEFIWISPLVVQPAQIECPRARFYVKFIPRLHLTGNWGQRALPRTSLSSTCNKCGELKESYIVVVKEKVRRTSPDSSSLASRVSGERESVTTARALYPEMYWC